MEKPNLEHRSYDFEVTAGEEGIITGRPIVYESRANIGAFDEIITRGALNGTNLTDVRFLVNHDKSKIPLARSRRNNENSTMQLIPDENGLSIRVKLDIENNAEARALYSAVKRGDVTGMSFAFGVGKDEWENVRSAHPTRHIRSISSVVEVSAVTFPAYDATSINARDSLTALENARRTLESVREDDGLELARAKAKAQMEVRFNHNHDSKGRFSSGGGGAKSETQAKKPKTLFDKDAEEIKNGNTVEVMKRRKTELQNLEKKMKSEKNKFKWQALKQEYDRKKKEYDALDSMI